MTKPAKKPKSSTQVSITKLFKERMQREGRSMEFSKAIRAIQDKTGQKYGQAFRVAMRELGYAGPEKERQHEREWIQGMDYEKAMEYLPKSAAPEIENEWAKNHPAMTRKDLLAEGDERLDANGKVKVTAWDLFFAPHGRCPSMGAAVKLARWVNNSKALDVNMAAGVKKSETNDGSKTAKESETVVDDGLEELKRLLGEVA